jgi:CheY-like chemotaxis protein
VGYATQKTPVLVVDDNDEIRQSLGFLLEARGYAVSTAVDGIDALGQLHGGLRPTVVILDLNMPRMDGRRLRQRMLEDDDLNALPVVILSAAQDIERIAYSLRAADYMPKPCNIDRLCVMLRTYCMQPT